MSGVGRAAAVGLVVLLLGACGSESPVRGALGSDTWVLTAASIDGSELVLAGSNPVTLSASGDSSARGSAGCNDYEADVSVDGTAMKLFVVAMTEADCADERSMVVEDAFVPALERVDGFDGSDERLVLSGDGVVLEFTTQPDE